MNSHVLALSDKSIFCEYVPVEDFKGFLQQRIGVGPDLLALLIRDGQLATASHGAHIAVGGMWRSVKDALFGKHSLKLLIADLKPFSVTAGFQGLSKDSVAIEAAFIIGT